MGPTGAAGQVVRAIRAAAADGTLPIPPHRPTEVLGWDQPPAVTIDTWDDESKLRGWAAVAPGAEVALAQALRLRTPVRWWRKIRGNRIAHRWSQAEVKALSKAWVWEWGEQYTVGNAWWVDPTVPLGGLSPRMAEATAPIPTAPVGKEVAAIRHVRPRGPRVWWANARPVVGSWFALFSPVGFPRSPEPEDWAAGLNPRFNPAQGQARPRWAWPEELQ